MLRNTLSILYSKNERYTGFVRIATETSRGELRVVSRMPPWCFFCYNTHMNFEEPIMPPEGDGRGKRYESADLDMGELKTYITDTVFEDKNAIVLELTDRYGMPQRSKEYDIKVNMTRALDKATIAKMLAQINTGLEAEDYYGSPVSGEEPEEVLSVPITTLDMQHFILKIYKVTNRKKNFRFEYILSEKSI